MSPSWSSRFTAWWYRLFFLLVAVLPPPAPNTRSRPFVLMGFSGGVALRFGGCSGATLGVAMGTILSSDPWLLTFLARATLAEG